MSNEQETLIDFPCDFTIKAMGKTNSDFKECVIAIGRRHDPKFDATRVVARESKHGSYTSLSLIVYAENKPHLDAIYQDLHDSEHVLWAI
ncbi:MAG: transcriptional regulator [Proteobacteria bacterium]|nr:MAG: transcriptional regulator [Pseudomonadota bacterium]